ncbi:DUF1127 domain-containing protein [Rhizobium sp. P38BS-XIX]|uniref:DUF1127 domain-containing protein n=1 Tax=Rhizobium sp. P38BS-XIX TaxID=2726740 RepID=UPI00145753C7|nr:DUF1127 domain-containing protein [Rhizobium sp. P38BS-XIX]NLR95382.1 DUF1127 domain-containing protein [Rhizobium sp. P38BS-XIX]
MKQDQHVPCDKQPVCKLIWLGQEVIDSNTVAGNSDPFLSRTVHLRLPETEAAGAVVPSTITPQFFSSAIIRYLKKHLFAIRRKRTGRREVSQLAELSDHTLKDIGLQRWQI